MEADPAVNLAPKFSAIPSVIGVLWRNKKPAVAVPGGLRCLMG